jgi:hypothetical protein
MTADTPQAFSMASGGLAPPDPLAGYFDERTAAARPRSARFEPVSFA